MNNEKTKFDSMRSKTKIPSMFERKKKFMNSNEILSLANDKKKAKSKKSSLTNKCSYAYDNLAYGFTNDVKQTGEI
jgi:hypothetical protein